MPRGHARTFLIFLLGGLAIAAAVFSLLIVGDIVWTDFLHDNPHRTRQHALLLAALSPLYGVSFAIVGKLLAILVGATLAVLGRAILRDLPLWCLIAMLPVCVLAEYVQGSVLRSGFWLPEPGEEPFFVLLRLLRFSAYEVPALLGCWWLDRRTNSR
jgi:hypothetical protein